MAVRAMAPVTGMPPTSGDSEIGHALRQQLGVRVVPVAGHRVGDDRRQQALDRRQQRHRQRRRQQRQDQVRAERRACDRRQARSGSRRTCEPIVSTGRPNAATASVPATSATIEPGTRGSQRGHQQHDGEATQRRAHAPRRSPSAAPRPSAAMRAKNSLGDPAMPRPEEVLDLRGRDQQRDAVGEADDDRPRDELAPPGRGRSAPGTPGSRRPSS